MADAAPSPVGGGPGDPGLVTVRGRHAVAEADVVVADHLAPQALLASLPPEVEVIDASKLPRGRSMAQEQINALLVDTPSGQAGGAAQGRRPVRLRPRHGGARGAASPPASRSRSCRGSPAPRRPRPGRLPVTHRGLSHGFSVVSGHLPPGHPNSLVDWAALGRLRGTVVVLMGVDTAPAIAAALIEHGEGRQHAGRDRVRRLDARPSARCGPPCPSSPRTVADEGIRPPAVWVVGDVVALDRPHDKPRDDDTDLD